MIEIVESVSRTRCGILHAAPQSRDPCLLMLCNHGPRLCSAPLRKSYALRCVRGTRHPFARNSRRSTLPVAVIGKVSANCTNRGYSCAAS
jgi:hypothetical protein